MNFIKTDIDGVVIIEPRIFTDSRGYFFESYNEAEFIKNGITNRFVQDNQSKSSYGVVRGLHCQLGPHAQAKLVRVLHGRVLDVAVDIRAARPHLANTWRLNCPTKINVSYLFHAGSCTDFRFCPTRRFLHTSATTCITLNLNLAFDLMTQKSALIGGFLRTKLSHLTKTELQKD